MGEPENRADVSGFCLMVISRPVKASRMSCKRSRETVTTLGVLRRPLLQMTVSDLKSLKTATVGQHNCMSSTTILSARNFGHGLHQQLSVYKQCSELFKETQ